MAQVQRPVAWVTTALLEKVEIILLRADRAENQGAVVDGMDVGAVRILPPWLQKQAGFPGDDVACFDGNLRR